MGPYRPTEAGSGLHRNSTACGQGPAGRYNGRVAQRVLGVLAGGDSDPRALVLWAGSADVLLAADGGADSLLAAGYPPHAIVGDFDSASPLALASGARPHRDPDPHRSDCDKLLGFALAEGHDAITLAGVEGDRFDHVFANLLSAASVRIAVRLVFRGAIGWIVRAGERVEVAAPAGRTVSLLPIDGPCRASLAGVRWPLDAAEMGVGKIWSVSNEALGPLVRAEVQEGAALLQVQIPLAEQPVW